MASSARTMVGLTSENAGSKAIMIDAMHLKEHRTAFNLWSRVMRIRERSGGSFSRRTGEPNAG